MRLILPGARTDPPSALAHGMSIVRQPNSFVTVTHKGPRILDRHDGGSFVASVIVAPTDPVSDLGSEFGRQTTVVVEQAGRSSAAEHSARACGLMH